ncbi:hypothetical protein Pcinc_018695, partial [Petrolisthes cinctipes]
ETKQIFPDGSPSLPSVSHSSPCPLTTTHSSLTTTPTTSPQPQPPHHNPD